MRRGFDNSLVEENGVFYGISLGADFCAEHEWGIKGITRKFGIVSDKLGVESRTISKSDIKTYKGKNHMLLITNDWYLEDRDTLVKALPRDLYLESKDELQTAWDEGSFGILVSGKENIEKLELIEKAFQENNIVITFFAPKISVFGRSSLAILIKDKIPQERIDQMYQVDKKHFDLYEYEKQIGVTKLKEDGLAEYRKDNGGKTGKGKYFMACSPRWIDYEDEENRENLKTQYNTKYDIRFWVNYADDDNYGWYNAEDIIKWLSTPGLKLKSLNKEKI
jgi:hypothetical protein